MPRPMSEYRRIRRRSPRSLIAPPNSSQTIVGTVIAIPTTESAAGVFHNEYAVHAIATRRIPSPTSEMLIPAHSNRKSRERSGLSRPTRSMLPRRSSPSKLCCIGVELGDHTVAVRDRTVAAAREILGERAERHRPAEQEALAQLEAEVLEQVDLVGALDAFGDDFEPEPLADRHDRGRETVVVDAAAEERPVHLEDVDRQAAEVAEGRVAGAEVVHRDTHAE